MELSLSGKTIADLLEELSKQIPELPYHLFEDEHKEKVKGFVKILINGRGIEHLGNLQAMLKEGDVIAIAPPIGGGGTKKLPKDCLISFAYRLFLVNDLIGINLQVQIIQ